MVTLAIGVVAVLVTALTPAWLLMKSATLGAGILFFGCFPIATNFPEYRLLVSPMKRILWKIPTHGKLRPSLSLPFISVLVHGY